MMSATFKKTLSWSVVVFTMAGIVAYIVTGNTTKAVIIGTCELIWEPPCYFIHEHGWKFVHRRAEQRAAREA